MSSFHTKAGEQTWDAAKSWFFSEVSQINIFLWVCILKLIKIITVKGKTILSHPYTLASEVTFLFLPNMGGQGLIVKDGCVKSSAGNVEPKCWRQN